LIPIKEYLHFFHHNKSFILKDWFEFLKFQSISASTNHRPDCIACAKWLITWLKKNSFHAQLIPTKSNPLVFAEQKGNPSRPVILLYGHYDVQPVDPLSAWQSPPFEPVLKNNRVYARGAEDNKGQLIYALWAIRALIQTGSDIPTLKILIDGDEECGSKGINTILPKLKKFVKSNVMIIPDTNTAQDGTPSIVMGLRGIIHLTIELHGPKHDLHSGVHGGIAPNPATELSKLITTFYDRQGNIAIKNFLSNILPVSSKEKELLTRYKFDAANYKKITGVPPLAGNNSLPPVIRTGFMPSIDINGINSGYNGDGIKTIIPASAKAKITVRLAAGQDPQKILSLLVKHIKKNKPEGLTLKIPESGIGGAGFRVSPDSPVIQKALNILDKMSNGEAAILWEGASIPVIASLMGLAGAEPIMVGFGHDSDNAHAPNESFSLKQMQKGFQFITEFITSV